MDFLIDAVTAFSLVYFGVAFVAHILDSVVARRSRCLSTQPSELSLAAPFEPQNERLVAELSSAYWDNLSLDRDVSVTDYGDKIALTESELIDDILESETLHHPKERADVTISDLIRSEVGDRGMDDFIEDDFFEQES